MFHLCVLPLVLAFLTSGATQLATVRIGRAVDGSAVVLTIEHRTMRASAVQKVEPLVVKSAPHPLQISHRQVARQVVASRVAQHQRPMGTQVKHPIGVAVILPSAEPTPAPTRKPAPVSVPGNETARVAPPAHAVGSPAPSPSVAPESAEVAGAADVPAGGWGQNFRDPTVLDGDALASLRSRYHDAVAHVEVDEDGHATDVTIEGGTMAPDERAELVAHLKTMRYVPAECNGLRCAAALQIKV